MSHVPLTLKDFRKEIAEKNYGKNKAVLIGDSSLDLNQSLEEIDPTANLVLNSADAIKSNPPKATKPPEVIDLDEPEYSCNYCSKKFFNKQALGGHQNAHKLERDTERYARKGYGGNFGYTGNQSFAGMTSFPFHSSFNQANKKTDNQFVMNSPHYPQFMQHQVHANGYPAIGFCTNPTSSQFMSFYASMGRSADILKGKFSAVPRNAQAEHHSQSENSENQPLEDVGLDLSLKL